MWTSIILKVVAFISFCICLVGASPAEHTLYGICALPTGHAVGRTSTVVAHCACPEHLLIENCGCCGLAAHSKVASVCSSGAGATDRSVQWRSASSIFNAVAERYGRPSDTAGTCSIAEFFGMPSAVELDDHTTIHLTVCRRHYVYLCMTKPSPKMVGGRRRS
mmetsp:Transcript_35489/g.58794  ORF Transcript_35489/g.58794 Transcript_35489/m.58794 type:complete len:163 (+) Transcript_35489:115-603(+)